MRISLVLTVLLSIAAMTPVSAAPMTAINPVDQIRTALLAGDMASLEAKLAASPSLQPQSLEAMAAYSQQNYEVKSDLAAAVLALMVKYSAAVNSSNGSAIAVKLADLYSKIGQKDVLGCIANNSKSSESKKDQPNHYRAMMQSMEQLAALPSIIASSPDLFAKIKAVNVDCDEKSADETLPQLSQYPNSGRSILPRNSEQVLNNTLDPDNSEDPEGPGNPPPPPGFPPEGENSSPN